MILASIPYKFQYVWAADATAPTYLTAPVPASSTSPAASQQLGFPPATANPSGTPPAIGDFNGTFQYLSAWAQWQQAGGPIRYDATFSGWVGGYPQGALLASTTLGQYWVNQVDGNTTDPDGGGAANWLPLLPTTPVSASQLQSAALTGAGNWLVPPDVTQVRVTSVGGGGGQCYDSAGPTDQNGADGGCVIGVYTVTPGTMIAYSCGAGGAGSNNGTVRAASGGPTTFGGFQTAGGGQGGLADAVSPPTPGTSTGGTLRNSWAATKGTMLAGEGTGATTATAYTWAIGSSAQAGSGGNGDTSVLNTATGGTSGAILLEWVG